MSALSIGLTLLLLLCDSTGQDEPGEPALIIAAGMALSAAIDRARSTPGANPSPPPRPVTTRPVRPSSRVLPIPAESSSNEGDSWKLSRNFKILTTDNKPLSAGQPRRAATRMLALVEKLTGFPLVYDPADEPICHTVLGSVQCTPADPLSLLLVDCKGCSSQYSPQLGEDEAYSLSVNRSRVLLSCKGNSGLVHGLDSFLQLLSPHNSAPRTQWEVTVLYDETLT